MDRNRTGAVVALGALALIWGYNWVVMKQALAWSAPVDLAALRALIGGLCLLGVLVATRGPLRPVRVRSVVWLALLQTAGFVGCIALALSTGPVGKSTILAYTMPFWAMLFAAWFLDERIRGLQWLALLMAAAGLVGVINPFGGGFTPAASGFALAAGLFWGLAVVVGRRLEVKDNRELINVTAWQALLGGVLLAVLGLFLDGPETVWNTRFVLALAYVSLPATALAWLLWLYILQHLSAAVSGLSSLGVPVVSIACAWLVLGEAPGLGEAVGMAIILLALGVLSLAAWRARRPDDA